MCYAGRIGVHVSVCVSVCVCEGGIELTNVCTGVNPPLFERNDYSAVATQPQMATASTLS